MDKDDKISLNCSFLYQNKEGFSLLLKNLSYITLKLIASFSAFTFTVLNNSQNCQATANLNQEDCLKTTRLENKGL